MQEQLSETEQDEFKGLVKKEDIIRELERIDSEIMRLHAHRYRCKRDFVASPQSELLKLKRSFLFAKLCDSENEDEWGELKRR
jgi:hypothetical protein